MLISPILQRRHFRAQSHSALVDNHGSGDNLESIGKAGLWSASEEQKMAQDPRPYVLHR